MKARAASFFVSAVGMLSLAVCGDAAAANWTADAYVLAPGDFNNDGKADLLVIAKDAAQPTGIALGDSGNQPSVFHQSWTSSYLGITWSGNAYLPLIGDFNGDNYDDIFLQRNAGGNHYVLLNDGTAHFTQIHQTISNSYLGVSWSQAERRIVVGNFNNAGGDDLFLQANGTAFDSVVALSSLGTSPFLTVSPPTPWPNSHLTLEWSLLKAVDHAGDFNGDGYSDWFVHAKPNWVLIPLDDLMVPVPVHRPASHGIAFADGTGRAATLGQAWNHDYLGFEWSTLQYDALVANFGGDACADILLQAKRPGYATRMVISQCGSQPFASPTVHVLGAGVSWDQTSYQLRAGDFNGDGRADIYMQAAAGGTNRIAYTDSNGNVTTTPVTHAPSGNFKKPVPGVLPGGFAVGDEGQGTYAIPIEAPAATGGLKPSLALTYNHLAGNGLAGMGWNLAGIQAITRCGRTYAQDGSVIGISYTNADAFCLNGQRLVAIDGGTHGASGTQYRTEIETFQRVVQLDTVAGGPHSFRVDHGNGLSSYFGVTDDSRVEVSSGSGAVKIWYISYTEDRFGNRIKYAYEENTATGETVPTEVSWTEKQGYLTPKYKATIVYEPRPADDARTGRDTAGMLWAQSKRIDKIDVVYDGTQLIHTYDLSYAAPGGTGRSRLQQVQLCGPNECMPATTFTVQNGTSGWGAMVDTGYSVGTGPVFAGDVDGDGRQDIVLVGASGNWHVHYGTASGSLGAAVNTGISAGPVPHTARIIDFNSDAIDQLLFKSTSTWKVLGRYGSTFTAIDTGVSITAPSYASIADYDGDGIDDWLYMESGSPKWRRNNGGTFAAAQTLSGLGGTDLYDHSNRRAPDFNGDGRDDAIRHSDYCVPGPEGGQLCTPVWTIVVASGTAGYTVTHQLQGSFYADIFSVNALDLNGDGLDDLIYIDTDTWYTQLSTATGFAAPVSTGIGWVSAEGGIFADYDHDGREDLMRAVSGTLYVHRSNGATLPATPIASLSSAGYPGVADINGDGFDDLITGPYNGTLRIHQHQTPLPDVVTGVTDGLGYHVGVTYESHINSASYTVNGAAPTSFYIQYLKEPRHIVTSEVHDNGIGGTRTFNHLYDSAYVDVSGRDWSVFNNHRVDDVARGTHTITEFSTAFPTVGHVTKQELLKTSGNQLIREVVNDVQATAISGTTPNRQFVRTESSITKGYEVGGVADAQHLRTIVVDPVYDETYGYLTSTTRTVINAAVTEGWTSATVFTRPATPLLTPWCLDVPDVVETTNTMVPATSTSPPRKTRYFRDSTTCAVTETRDESETSQAKQLKTTITYDLYGNVDVATLDDVSGPAPARSTNVDFDANGQFPTSVTVGGVNLTTQMTFNVLNGQRASVTGPDGLSTSFLYDDFGRVTKETRPVGYTNFAYEDCLTCWPLHSRFSARAQGSDGSDAYQFFDELRRPVGSSWTLPQGSHARREARYNALGQVSQASQPYVYTDPTVYWVTNQYDLLGRLTQEDAPLSEAQPSSFRTTLYDYRGLERWVTDPESHTTKYIENAAGQIKQVIDALSNTTSYSYKPFGELASVLDVEGNTTSIGYDNRGFKASMTDPNMGNWLYDHNVFGELGSQTNGAGQTVTLAYDTAGRTQTRTEVEGVTSFTYHGAGVPGGTGKPNLISRTNHSETYTFDPATGQPSRIRRTLDGTIYDFDFAFDGQGRLDVMSYPDIAGYRFRVDYDFDPTGHLTAAKDGNTSAIFYALSQADALGRDTLVTLGSGVTEQRVFDRASGNLSSLDTGPSGTSTIQDLAFTWDEVGNLKTRYSALNGKTETFVYDALDRLTSAQVNGLSAVTMGYSAAGRITSKSDVPGTWTYGAGPPGPNALTSVGSTNYNYDTNGRMTSHGTDAFTWYSYDLPKKLAVGTKTAELFYGVGRDRYKQIQKTGSTTNATIYYVGSLFEKEVAGSTTTYRHFVNAGGRAVAVVKRVGTTNTVQYLHRDHQGSVVEVTGSTGPLVQSLAFDAWGLRRNASTWAALASPFAGTEPTERGYTGHEHLDRVELIHMNGRVQDPKLGRFISADPFVQAPYHSQSLNRYSYVWNNPASLVDPSGFQGEKCTEDYCSTITAPAHWQQEFEAWLWWYLLLGASEASAQTDAGDGGGGGGGGEPPGEAPPPENCWNGEEGDPLDFVDGMRRQIGNDAYDLSRMAVVGPIADFHTMLLGEDPFGSNDTNKGILGADLAFIPETLAGGAGGLGFSGTALRGSRAAGTSFSHMWPNRWGGPLTIFNGRVVPNSQHAMHDSRFFPKGMTAADKFNPLVKAWDRVPPLWRGAIGAGVFGKLNGGCRGTK